MKKKQVQIKQPQKTILQLKPATKPLTTSILRNNKKSNCTHTTCIQVPNQKNVFVLSFKYTLEFHKAYCAQSL